MENDFDSSSHSKESVEPEEVGKESCFSSLGLLELIYRATTLDKQHSSLCDCNIEHESPQLLVTTKGKEYDDIMSCFAHRYFLHFDTLSRLLSDGYIKPQKRIQSGSFEKRRQKKTNSESNADDIMFLLGRLLHNLCALEGLSDVYLSMVRRLSLVAQERGLLRKRNFSSKEPDRSLKGTVASLYPIDVLVKFKKGKVDMSEENYKDLMLKDIARLEKEQAYWRDLENELKNSVNNDNKVRFPRKVEQSFSSNFDVIRQIQQLWEGILPPGSKGSDSEKRFTQTMDGVTKTLREQQERATNLVLLKEMKRKEDVLQALGSKILKKYNLRLHRKDVYVEK